MLFSEVYSAYFEAVSRILSEAIDGPIPSARMDEIVRETAFSESVLTIGPALKSGEWPLMTADGRAVVRSAPQMPVTLLEKRWLKTLLSDPRIALFGPPSDGLEDVAPLFNPSDIHWFDQCLDGDPYSEPEYIVNFQTVLRALRDRRKLRIVYENKRGRMTRGVFAPDHLEYSQKDDKFRLQTLGGRRVSIRLSSIRSCEPDEPFDPDAYARAGPNHRVLELNVTDERNAMERAMLHFSHFKKEAERVGDDRYRMKLWYEAEDETELVIRVLSFGPMVEVASPMRFKAQVVERLRRQTELF